MRNRLNSLLLHLLGKGNESSLFLSCTLIWTRLWSFEPMYVHAFNHCNLGLVWFTKQIMKFSTYFYIYFRKKTCFSSWQQVLKMKLHSKFQTCSSKNKDITRTLLEFFLYDCHCWELYNPGYIFVQCSGYSRTLRNLTKFF